MKYKILIKDGLPDEVFVGEEIPLDQIKSIVYVGKENEHARIEFKNGDKVSLTEDDVQITYK